MDLDPWQQWVLETACAEEVPGRWSAFEVGLMISRQNGKTALLEARELVGLFVLGERLIIHSAHLGDTARDAYRRLLARIDSLSTLRDEVLRAPAGRGSEAIELKNGSTVQYRTRTGGGGLGFSADLVIFDESMMLPTTYIGTLMPTLSARPNPQLIYAGSAVDQKRHEHGLAFARIRDRAKKQDKRLFYAEWSAVDSVTVLTPEVAADPVSWAAANPALGIRISTDYVEDEHRSMPARDFAVMRLGAGDWPATTEDAGKVIPPALWNGCADPTQQMAGPVCLAFDVSPTRSGSIAAAWQDEDGNTHTQVVANDRGTQWMVDRIVELTKEMHPAAIAVDAGGPAGSLVPQLEKFDRDVQLTLLNAKDLTQACGMFYDALLDGTLRHDDSEILRQAVDGATRRSVGEAWAWARKSALVDLSPLVAVTLAHMQAKSLRLGVGAASGAEWRQRHGPEAIAEMQRKRDERMAALLAKARGGSQ